LLKGIFMLYCPVCKSRNIFPVAGGYIGQVYLCKDCKYRGSFVLETDDEPEPESEKSGSGNDR
jgi:transposase-like protein